MQFNQGNHRQANKVDKLDFHTVNSEEDAEKLIASNPYIGNVFKRMIKEGIKEEVDKFKLQEKTGTDVTGKNNVDVRPRDIRVDNNKVVEREKPSPVKSPSDTTIYALALNTIPAVQQGQDEIIEKNLIL